MPGSIFHNQKAGVLFALGAATLFGLGTPAAKVLVGDVPPVMLASLLYLGSALGLGLWIVYSRIFHKGGRETPLSLNDAPWLMGAIVSGGVAGPVLLMFGLERLPGSNASLLLNLEAVFTISLAWIVFHENFDRRIASGALLILLGGVALSWQGRLEQGNLSGSILVAGACLAWAIDNNLTRKISGGDPVQIAFLKGLIGGLTNLALALSLGNVFPALGKISFSALVGLIGYGISLVLFILALRNLGAARTGAYFSVAPFIGSIFAVLLIGESVTLSLIIASILMGLGVWLHLTEKHVHQHSHESLIHDHRHDHDEHHKHSHPKEENLFEVHSHSHSHEVINHSHPHYPDIHHRHDHGK